MNQGLRINWPQTWNVKIYHRMPDFVYFIISSMLQWIHCDQNLQMFANLMALQTAQTMTQISLLLFTRKNKLYTHTHTHNRFTALLESVRDHPGEQAPERYNQEGWNQSEFTGEETVSGSGICWAICKSAPQNAWCFHHKPSNCPENGYGVVWHGLRDACTSDHFIA